MTIIGTAICGGLFIYILITKAPRKTKEVWKSLRGIR